MTIKHVGGMGQDEDLANDQVGATTDVTDMPSAVPFDHSHVVEHHRSLPFWLACSCYFLTTRNCVALPCRCTAKDIGYPLCDASVKDAFSMRRRSGCWTFIVRHPARLCRRQLVDFVPIGRINSTFSCGRLPKAKVQWALGSGGASPSTLTRW